MPAACDDLVGHGRDAHRQALGVGGFLLRRHQDGRQRDGRNGLLRYRLGTRRRKLRKQGEQEQRGHSFQDRHQNLRSAAPHRRENGSRHRFYYALIAATIGDRFAPHSRRVSNAAPGVSGKLRRRWRCPRRDRSRCCRSPRRHRVARRRRLCRRLAAVPRPDSRQHVDRDRPLPDAGPPAGPKVLWKTTVADGYAGAAIRDGRRLRQRLRHGEEGAPGPRHLPRHGQGRLAVERRRSTSARTTGSRGPCRRSARSWSSRWIPKCRFHVLDAKTGKLVWQKNLVQEYKATIPGWYAGQNPLLDGDRVVLATGGDAIAVAFDQATGKEVWRSPNPGKDVMSHASLMPATIGGVKQYLYLTMNKVVGIAAADGQLLWSIPFAAKMAACPSPLSIGDGRVFITSGYEAGSMMIQVEKGAAGFHGEEALRPDRRAVQLGSAHARSSTRTISSRSAARRAGGSPASASTGRSCGRAPSSPETPRPRRRSSSARSCWLTGCSSCSTAGRVCSACSRRARRSTRNWPARRCCPAKRSGARWRSSNGKLIIRDMNQMVCLQVGLAAGAK